MKNCPMNSVAIIYRWIALVFCSIALAACGTITSTPIVPIQTLVLPTDTLAPLPTLSPAPTATQTPRPLNLHPQVVVLAGNLPEPDDLVLAPDGSILISDVSDGSIKQLGRDGQLRLVVSGLSAPEGMVLLPDGSLIIAEQGRNRLVRYDFKSNTLTPLLNLENHTGNPGVDGLAWNGSDIIVPDSPNGRVLEVSPDGATVRQIGSGLARPAGAWAEADGNLLIADENGNAVARLHPDGSLEKIFAFSIPDDVIEDAEGNIFVVTLGDDAIHVIPAGSNQDVVLVSGLSNPHGIIFDSDGNLVVTDSGNHRLIKVIIH